MNSRTAMADMTILATPVKLRSIRIRLTMTISATREKLFVDMCCISVVAYFLVELYAPKSPVREQNTPLCSRTHYEQPGEEEGNYDLYRWPASLFSLG